ncbi:MAG: biotin/lipoyl-containing protein [Kouleothrix sp.]
MNKIQVVIDGMSFDIDVQIDPQGRAIAIVDGETLPLVMEYQNNGTTPWALVGSRSYEIEIDSQLRWIRTARQQHLLDLRDRDAQAQRPASGDGRVKAPIPGTITRLMVAAGDQVSAGQPLLVLEAMKMENQVNAPRSGTIERLNVVLGQSVTLGAVMAEIA